MTNSSSKPLQTLGKWYQPRNQKKNPKPAPKKNPKTISHPNWNLDGSGQAYAYKIESFNLHTSFSMKMVDERVQDTTGSNFIGVRYGKIPKVAIL